MAKHLVIVESPAKAKTVNRYLGSDYLVKACLGHIRDLPKNRLGVDIENDFEPEYQVLEARKKTVAELQKTAKQCDSVLLAADPDREGEAICWHLAAILKDFNPNIRRVMFHEITSRAVKESFRNVIELDQSKFNAQQTRRILDRLVGYRISPLLWKKIGRGLSAGRVQSIALRLICEREKEIKDFNPEEFWKLTAYLKASNPPEFQAGLDKIGGRKKKVETGKEAENIITELKKLPFELKDVKIKEKKKNPQAPYITSTLQQDSFRINRFSVKKTMMVAQKLYEGINIGDKGLVGIITYMRTDSFRVSNDAIKSCRQLIQDDYSAEYLPGQPRIYKNKRKAQDAHEAIRPTSFDLPPEKIKLFLNKEQYRLYTMIWFRFIASQMKPALIEETVFDIQAGKYQFQAKGEVIKFAGFMVVYPRKSKEGKILPKALSGEELKLLKLEPEQKFTQPPPRYTEGSLVKELEARGIGRPSTYVPIISTLVNRDYVITEKGKFIPLELGIFVTDYLIENFPELMKFEFTVHLEEKLDKISEGEAWVGYLESYNSLLEKNLNDAEKTESVKAKGIPSEDKCPECGKELVIKSGRYGRFKACSGYPDCTFKQSIGKKEAKPVDEKCPKCGSQMVLRRGKYGPFVACSNYPSCKYIKKEKKDTGISCPECDGTIVQKKTRKGKLFFGCSNFPKCKFASWDEPVKKPCPECNREFVLRKNTMTEDAYLYCSDKNCGYKETVKAKQIWERNQE